MKRHWKRILAAAFLAAVLLLCAGFGIGQRAARAEENSGMKTYTDSQGRRFRVIPLADGRYELWMLTGVKSDEELTAELECKHLNIFWEKGNGQFHWQHCPDCGKTFEPLAHVYDRITVKKKATCTANAVLERKCVCGRVDTGNTAPVRGDPAEYFAHHTWGSGWQHDRFGHWQVCTVCGEKGTETAHVIRNLAVDREPTCLNNGWVSFDCAVCGEHVSSLEAADFIVEKYPELAQYRALGHDFSGPLKVAHGDKKQTERKGGTHAKSCTRCGTADLLNATPHSWAEYTISNGTCEDESDPVVIGGTCECGATLELSYTRHHKYVKDSSRDVQPTCTEPGKLNGERCVYCGIFGNYDFAEPLGHDWIEEKEKYVEPTCTTMGESHWYCWRCLAEETRPIKTRTQSGQHEFVRHDIQTAECCGKGWYIMVCKICGEDDKQGNYYVDKLPHNTYTTTKKIGRVMDGTTRDGTPMVGQVWESVTKCHHCHETLGRDEWTVWKSLRGNRYQIYDFRKTTPPRDTKDMEVVTGQMARDGGTYFESEIQKAFGKKIKENQKKYELLDVRK